MEYENELTTSGNSEQKEIIELLLNPDKIALASHYNDSEIVPLSLLEAFAKNPLMSCEGVKIKLDLITEFITYFKINRISKDRLSREELIKGIVSFNSEDKSLKDKMGGFLQNMF